MDLQENLRMGDLKLLVDTFISVDQYTSKLDADNITVAFFCNEKPVAEDLLDFIEKTYYVEIRDIELADTITKDNKFIVFVEFERNGQFPLLLCDMLESLSFLVNRTDWTFKTFGNDKEMPVSVDELKKSVRLTKYAPKKQEVKNKEVKEHKTPIQYSKGNLTRTYLDEGYVSEEEFNTFIESCESLNENALDKEVIEYNMPGCEVITTDNKVFVVGDKIRMYGVK
jgi:hypothetical protein